MTQLNNMNFRPFDKDTTPAELYELRDVMTTFAAGSMDASDGYFYITMGPEMGKPPTLWDGPFVKATPENLRTALNRLEQKTEIA